MSPATVIIILILLVIVLLSVKSYLKKLSSGCCGGRDKVQKTKAADSDPRHYSYHKVVMIDGMVCANCAQRVENAFNTREGCMSKVSVGKKRADIYTKTELDDGIIRQVVAKAGYTVTNIETADA